MLVFRREENLRTWRKTLGARREPTTNASHTWRMAGTEPWLLRGSGALSPLLQPLSPPSLPLLSPPPPTFKKNFRKSLFQRCHVAACFRWNAFQIHRRTMYAPHWALMSKFPFFLLIWCHSNSFSSLISGKRVFFWSDFYRWPIWANNETFPARYNTKASSDEYCSSASSLCQATGNETFNTREIFYIYDFL